MSISMTKTIAKTFRISPVLAREIENEAKNQEISQGEYLARVFFENKKMKLKKEFERNLAMMEHDVQYKKEQVDLANADFL